MCNIIFADIKFSYLCKISFKEMRTAANKTDISTDLLKMRVWKNKF